MNTLNKKLILITAMMLLMVAGCGKDDVTTPTTTNNAPFTFLKVGNEWEYGRYDADELNGTIKFIIASENNGVFEVIMTENNVPVNTVYWYIKDGWWNDFSSGLLPFCLPQNCSDGQELVVVDNGKLEITSVSKTITIPAGTFNNCIETKLSATGMEQYSNYYYHKDIGFLSGIYENKKSLKLHSKNF
jgi:hypothetical protein